MGFLEIIAPLKELAIIVGDPLIEHDVLVVNLSQVYLNGVFHFLSIQEHLRS
jgi:hypothetical protein